MLILDIICTDALGKAEKGGSDKFVPKCQVVYDH